MPGTPIRRNTLQLMDRASPNRDARHLRWTRPVSQTALGLGGWELRIPNSKVGILQPEGPVFGTLGMPELILIFVVALLLFGPRKMPQIGRSIGRAMGEFRRASNEFKRTIEDEVAADEIRDVGNDLKDLRDVGKELRDLKQTVEKPIESTVKKALDMSPDDADTSSKKESDGS
jgi:TatA/E family protein of Tat protein translocase